MSDKWVTIIKSVVFTAIFLFVAYLIIDFGFEDRSGHYEINPREDLQTREVDYGDSTYIINYKEVLSCKLRTAVGHTLQEHCKEYFNWQRKKQGYKKI